MTRESFAYQSKPSAIFKTIKRPMAEVSFWSAPRKKWLVYAMIIDTGADYTILPMKASTDLGVDIEKQCQQYSTRGIGGSEKVYICAGKIPIKIGKLEAKIPIAFLERDDIPPLLGRHKSLNLFDVRFAHSIVSFRELRK